MSCGTKQFFRKINLAPSLYHISKISFGIFVARMTEELTGNVHLHNVKGAIVCAEKYEVLEMAKRTEGSPPT